MRLRSLLPLAMACEVLAANPVLPLSPASPADRPSLVVVIVVDQLRVDYLSREKDRFLPPGESGSDAGGFRYLMERGAWFPAARYRHYPLLTGPGHALLLTGGEPSVTGIIGNDWYSIADRKPVYCVADDSTAVVGGIPGSKAKPMSPRNLLATTVGDELKMATGRAARVVSISLKDRAAILMGGRMADAAIWFDDSTGRWISSRFYCPSGRLPGWVEELNALRVPDAWFGKRWVPLVPEGGSGSPGLAAESSSLAAIRLGRSFPHPVDGGLSAPGPAFYKAFALTPWANEFVFRTARQAVVSERLGQDETPDLLTVNLSSNDYIGHSFGPDSPEALDCLLRTDRELSAFFRYLASTVPGGLDRLLVALASDHGVDPVPEEMRAAGFPSTRVQESDLERRVDAALDTCFGPQDWVLAFADFNLYLNPDALAASDCGPEQIRRMAARTLSTTSGIYGAFTRNQIEEGRLPDTNPSRRLYGAYHPKRSGDVLVITDPFCFTEESPLKHLTTHGSPYAYNTSVPLLLTGPGIRPGVYADPVSPADLTPTLALLLGICPPSASDGIPLKSALR